MKKTTLIVDEELVLRARTILGTKSLRETVDRALQGVLELEARREAIRQLREMAGLELDNEEVMAQAWR
jgi:Arc/MetJ family transcription regulator